MAKNKQAAVTQADLDKLQANIGDLIDHLTDVISQTFATKEDLKQFATKEDLKSLRNDFDELRSDNLQFQGEILGEVVKIRKKLDVSLNLEDNCRKQYMQI